MFVWSRTNKELDTELCLFVYLILGSWKFNEKRNWNSSQVNFSKTWIIILGEILKIIFTYNSVNGQN